MACSCRTPTHCPGCNATLHVPLSFLEGSAGAATLLARIRRKDPTLARANLRQLAHGQTSCPGCGVPVEHVHERACVSENLASLGVTPAERENILSRISFPE